MKTVDVKLKTYSLHWTESPLGLTTQASFGFVSISKSNEVIVHTMCGTNQIFKHTQDLKKLKQLIEEFHILQINKVHQLWTKIDVKIK